jgi:hypothetical protein
MTEPPDAERDGRAQRWRRAKPLLTVGYAAGVPAMFPPPSRRRTRGVVVNSLGDVGYAAWWRKSGG